MIVYTYKPRNFVIYKGSNVDEFIFKIKEVALVESMTQNIRYIKCEYDEAYRQYALSKHPLTNAERFKRYLVDLSLDYTTHQRLNKHA